jgi:hypothetical protein
LRAVERPSPIFQSRGQGACGPVDIPEKVEDGLGEDGRLLDVRDMAGLLDFDETRSLDGGMHLTGVFRGCAVIFAAADQQCRRFDFAKPVTVIQAGERRCAAPIAIG